VIVDFSCIRIFTRGRASQSTVTVIPDKPLRVSSGVAERLSLRGRWRCSRSWPRRLRMGEHVPVSVSRTSSYEADKK